MHNFFVSLHAFDDRITSPMMLFQERFWVAHVNCILERERETKSIYPSLFTFYLLEGFTHGLLAYLLTYLGTYLPVYWLAKRAAGLLESKVPTPMDLGLSFFLHGLGTAAKIMRFMKRPILFWICLLILNVCVEIR